MKRLFLGLFSLALLAAIPFAQQNVPTLPYEPVKDFFKVPVDRQLGDMAGVAVNSKGSIFMLSRSEVSGPVYGAMSGRILEFDKSGRFVREIGRGLYAFGFGHGIRVDRHDNIWVADKGSDMVVKFRPDGQLDMVFGRRAEAAAGGNQPGAMPYIGPPDRSKPLNQTGRFLGPSDVAWDSHDNIYISDGYYNSRIAKLDKNGDWVTSFGEAGTGPGQFRNLHNIAIDSKDRIYIADRTNGRIQVFDNEFKFLYEWRLSNIPYSHDMSWFGDRIPFGQRATGTDNPGAPWSLCFTAPPNEYLYVGDGFPGRIYKMTLDGKVLGTYGWSGRQAGQFGWVHGLACPTENEIFAADENNFRVQKLVLRTPA